MKLCGTSRLRQHELGAFFDLERISCSATATQARCLGLSDSQVGRLPDRPGGYADATSISAKHGDDSGRLRIQRVLSTAWEIMLIAAPYLALPMALTMPRLRNDVSGVPPTRRSSLVCTVTCARALS